MKNIMYLILCVAFVVTWSCSDEPLDDEQYKKEIYLVGAIDQITYADLNYSNEVVQESFITVTSSGSKDIDRNVSVVLEFAPEIVDAYNERYFGEKKADKYFKILSEEFYEISSMTVELDPNDGIYKRLPIKVNTKNLHCDSVYVLPFQIASASEYTINKTLNTLMFSFKLTNDYAGDYAMMGTSAGLPISKIKPLKAVSENKVRMFVGANKDDDTTLVPLTTVVMEIATDGTVTITDWDETQGIEQVTGGGTYNSATKIFDIEYSYVNGAETIEVVETLVYR